MKNKIFKALSVLLTLAVILTTCVCAVGTASAAQAVFFVSATGSDENAGTTEQTAVATLGKAVELANVQYGTGDSVTIKLSGSGIQLGTVPEYDIPGCQNSLLEWLRVLRPCMRLRYHV